MPSLKHLYTYERKKDKLYYRCVHPDCTHFTKREDLEGKRALCKCGEEYIITNKRPQRHFQLAIPKCENCRKSKTMAASKAVAADIMTTLLGENTVDNTGEIEVVMLQPKPEPKQFEIEITDNKQIALLEDDEHEWED